MTPLEQELANLKKRAKQNIHMSLDEIRQAKMVIKQCTQRIEHNEQLLRELRLRDSKIHEGRTVPTDCACEEGQERCPYCY